MTPQEKAKELVEKFSVYADTFHEGNLKNAKQCAMIVCDELYKASHYVIDRPDYQGEGYNEYWTKVKQELEKL
jgi:hypothetical protein